MMTREEYECSALLAFQARLSSLIREMQESPVAGLIDDEIRGLDDTLADLSAVAERASQIADDAEPRRAPAIYQGTCIGD